MKTFMTALLVAGLAGCATSESAEPVPAPVPAVQPPPPPSPPPVAKPAEPAAPAPAPAPEPAAKKPAKGPLGLPALAEIQTQLGLEKKGLKPFKEVYDSYKDKAKAAQEKIKTDADKKAARKEAAALREEILGKLKEHCSDEQKKKLDEIAAPPKKEKKAK